MLKQNKRNLLLALIIGAAVIWYSIAKESFYPLLWYLIIFNGLTMRHQESQNKPVKDPFKHLIFSDSHLAYKGYSVELQKIDRIVFGKVEGYAIFQLPYNAGGKIGVCFDAKHMYRMKQKINQYLPHAEIIV